MTTGLSPVLVGRIARRLETRLGARQPGHCIRVDDLAPADALAIAGRIASDQVAFDVHVLAHHEPRHEREIKADRAIELRNRKQKPLLLLVPAGAGHAASSLDNSFEPLPLMEELRAVSADLEKELSATDIGRLIGDVKHVLGRTRQVESWTRFLGAVSEDPTARTVGSQLWQVGLVPDLGTDRIAARLLRNAKAAAAISRPSRPTARVIERLEQAEVKDSPFRQRLQAFLEQQDAGVLADAVRWTRDIGEYYAQSLSFDKWQLIDPQPAGLQQIKVTPFRKEDGAVDTRCKLRLDDADGQLYCDVTPDKPGTVVVRWTTEPAKTAAVAAWRIEVLPPFDLRAVDTAPLVATKVKGDKRQATLRVDVSEDDLTASTLFVVRVRGLDAGGGDLELDDGRAGDSRERSVRGAAHRPRGRSATEGGRGRFAREGGPRHGGQHGRRPDREHPALGSRRSGLRRPHRQAPRPDPSITPARWTASADYRPARPGSVLLRAVPAR